MIEHLSAEQISQWMMGDRTSQLEHHVARCEACRNELAQLETTLMQFRGAVRELSGSAAPPAWREPARRGSWFSWPRMALVTATLLLLITVPIYWSARARQRAEQERADALLLEQVDSAISRAVPAPMEPLVTLATWNSSPMEKRNVEMQ
jgi:hypothetical protein